METEESDANRKRPSDEVQGLQNQKGNTGLEVVISGKNGTATPISPPPKQDPKRPKTLQIEKPSCGVVKKIPSMGKSSDARTAVSPAEDRQTQ